MRRARLAGKRVAQAGDEGTGAPEQSFDLLRIGSGALAGGCRAIRVHNMPGDEEAGQAEHDDDQHHRDAR
jgi:hypothetical protein